ncbi:nucleoside-diphosphate-sugar epimerase [Emericellopsis atlantica]|uniref:Nucleoside-diphosphate-sugar epimerase n=1 Tax=Emericellopsis atlantica TaxID=2614577 RepID=A0A9P7ZQY3_9HYPO|nr:nucleoside-diphosphate-sugar epimerase [Emericellopsis atlantica]KAG9256055.1 nucleoside-diphosphate-sugar epimerase [Emericellopsis atlantica]
MAPSIFLTGATGYIGGTAHAHLVKAFPDARFVLLVRNEERAKPIKDAYRDTTFVYGSLNDSDVIEKAAAEADIVVHTADSSDNVNAAHAIAKGLAAGHSAEKPGFWLHTSGTNILTWYDHKAGRAGEAPLPEQTYHDIDDIDKILNLPDEADHRNVDKIVLAANSDAVRIAVLCPPTIYGEGSGKVNTRSLQAPELARGTLQKGFAPIVGKGLTEWDNVHVDDLGELYVKLAAATQEPAQRSNPEVFGLHAYYFAGGGSHRWSDLARWIAEEASKQGFLPEPLTKSVSQKEVEMMEGKTTSSWGRNSKGITARAPKYLGWEAKGVSLRETVGSLVASEARSLGLEPHERKA